MLVGLALWALLPMAAGAQDVTADFRSSEDFARVRTFSFAPASPDAANDDETGTYDTPFVAARTNAAIAAQLESRGLTRDDTNPDVYVRTRRSFRTEQTVYSYPWGAGYYGIGSSGWWGYPYGWGGPWGSSVYVEDRLRGTLTIDIAEAATGQLIWRGVGERSSSPTSDSAYRTKKINKEVAKIFKEFPR
jgi:hypothetical protein